MKRILIVSYLFAPNNSIGALRPTKIAKRLSDQGYCVDVVSAGYIGNDTMPFPQGIHRWYPMNQNKKNGNMPRERKAAKHHSLTIPADIRQIYRSYFARKRERIFYNFFRELYVSDLATNDYDVIFTSFGPLVSLECGLYVKKYKKSINWICDFRDPVITDITPFVFKGKWRWLEQKACRTADSIIAVSNGYVQRICGNRYRNKVYMIPNGYDTADIVDSDSTASQDDALHIVYVGALYEGRRKITPLFRALRELADEGKVDLSKVCFDYAGGDGAFLFAQAEECGMGAIVRDHAVLSREDCLKLQFSSHMLVLSTWNNKGEEGVFPGKFLEYMLIGRPIISLTDGNMPNGEVTQVMREGNFGVAYEAACDQEDRESLKSYIAARYVEWTQKGSITFEPVQAVLDRYNYDHIIKQIEELMHEG